MARITIKAIVPKTDKLIDQFKLDRELKGTLDKTGNIIRSDFRKTTRTWREKPDFRKTGPKSEHGGLVVEVFANNKVYFYLTHGTKSHLISPKRAGALRFQAGYRAKTRVRVVGSRSGGAFGAVAFSKGHRVSGIKAREFDKEIASRREKTFNSRVQAAFRRSVS